MSRTMVSQSLDNVVTIEPQHPAGFFHAVGDQLADLAPDCRIRPEDQRRLVNMVRLMGMPPLRIHRVHGHGDYASSSYNGAERRFVAPRGGFGPPQSVNGSFCFNHDHPKFSKMYPDLDKSVYENDNLRAENLPPDPNMVARKERKPRSDTPAPSEESASSLPAPRQSPKGLGPAARDLESAARSTPHPAASDSFFGPPQGPNMSFYHPDSRHTPTLDPHGPGSEPQLAQDKRLQRVKKQMRAEPRLHARTPLSSSPLSPFTSAGTLRPAARAQLQDAKPVTETRRTVAHICDATEPSGYRVVYATESEDDDGDAEPNDSPSATSAQDTVNDTVEVQENVLTDVREDVSVTDVVPSEIETATSLPKQLPNNDDSGIALDDTIMSDGDDITNDLTAQDTSTPPPRDPFSNFSQDSAYGTQPSASQDPDDPSRLSPGSDSNTDTPAPINTKKPRKQAVPKPAASRRSTRIKQKTDSQASQRAPPSTLGKRGRGADADGKIAGPKAKRGKT